MTIGMATFKGFPWHRYDVYMAGAVISVLPILAVFIAAHKYFMRGVTISGELQG